jgi:transposase-like protein
MYLNNVGIRKIARFLHCSSPLVVRWIKVFGKQVSAQLQNNANKAASQMPDIIEMDEIYTFVKKTAKGSCMACLL